MVDPVFRHPLRGHLLVALAVAVAVPYLVVAQARQLMVAALRLMAMAPTILVAVAAVAQIQSTQAATEVPGSSSFATPANTQSAIPAVGSRCPRQQLARKR
jgi:hypothetical protein